MVAGVSIPPPWYRRLAAMLTGHSGFLVQTGGYIHRVDVEAQVACRTPPPRLCVALQIDCTNAACNAQLVCTRFYFQS